MLSRALLVINLLLVLAGAVLHGAVTQRFQSFVPDPGRAERAHALVIEFGGHDGGGENGSAGGSAGRCTGGCESEAIAHDVPVKERSRASSRRYRHPGRCLAASTSIISGVPGAVATHTPDVCYTSSGYTMLSAPRRRTLALPNGTTAHYLEADFEKARATEVERVRVRWAWSVDGRWEAPDRPRFHYMRQPELFKLYVVTTLPPDEIAADDPPVVREFLAAAFEQYGFILKR